MSKVIQMGSRTEVAPHEHVPLGAPVRELQCLPSPRLITTALAGLQAQEKDAKAIVNEDYAEEIREWRARHRSPPRDVAKRAKERRDARLGLVGSYFGVLRPAAQSAVTIGREFERVSRGAGPMAQYNPGDLVGRAIAAYRGPDRSGIARDQCTFTATGDGTYSVYLCNEDGKPIAVMRV